MRTLFKCCAFVMGLLVVYPLGAQTENEMESPVTTQDPQTPAEPDVFAGETFQSRALDVISGETFTINPGGDPVIEVWLAEIEAPAYGERHWAASTQALADKIMGHDLTLHVISQRGFESGNPHLIAQVFLGDRWINREMVMEGMAGYSPEYFQSDELLIAEQQARQMQLGIWAE